MNRIVRHHEIPWLFPNLGFGSKYFITPPLILGKKIFVDLGDVDSGEDFAVRYVNFQQEKN